MLRTHADTAGSNPGALFFPAHVLRHCIYILQMFIASSNMLQTLFLFAGQLVLGFGFFSINVLCKMGPSNILKPYPLLLNIRMQIVRSALQTKPMLNMLFSGSKNSNVGQECHVKYVTAKLIRKYQWRPNTLNVVFVKKKYTKSNHHLMR